jgi:Zn-dependent protease with chaperone function
VCELLPFWDAWLGPALAVALGCGVLGLVLALVRLLGVRRLTRSEAPWTERARLRAELKSACVAVAVAFGAVIGLNAAEARSASGCSSTTGFVVLTALGALALLYGTLGALGAAYSGQRPPLRARLRSLACLLLVLRPTLLVTLLAMGVGGFAPHGAGVWAYVAAVAVALYAVSTGVLYGVGRVLGLVVPARPELVRAVERARLDVPADVRGIDELSWLMPNALAFPVTRQIAFTQAAADALTPDELHAIALHELGHLRESGFTRWFRPALGLVILPFAVAGALVESDQVTALGVLTVVVLALGVFGRRLVHRHETQADHHASAHSKDYATALETIHRLAGIPAVISKRSTHPSLYDRMLAAGVTPSYPRPKPPGRLVLLGVVLGTPLLVIGFALGMELARDTVASALGEKNAPYARVAIGGSAGDLTELARTIGSHDPRLAFALWQRSAQLATSER